MPNLDNESVEVFFELINSAETTEVPEEIYEEIEYYLDQYPALLRSFDQKDFKQRTPLHIACEEGNLRLVETLLRRCAADEVKSYINFTNKEYDMPALYYCANNKKDEPREKSQEKLPQKLKIAELLLDKGADYSHKNIHSGTTILYLAQQRNPQIAELINDFAQREAELKRETELKRESVYKEVQKSSAAIAQSAVSQVTQNFEELALQRGQELQQKIAAEKALALKQEQELQRKIDEEKALALKIEQEQQRKIATEKKSRQDFVVQKYREFKQNNQTIKIDLLKGDKFVSNARDAKNNSFLHHICSGLVKNCDEQLIKDLIAEGADVNCRNKEGETPLILACKSGYYEAVKSLQTHADGKIDYSIAGNNGDAFFSACSSGNTAIVKSLLEVLDENLINRSHTKNNRTALLQACCDSKFEVVSLLLDDPKVKLDAKDSRDNSVFHLLATVKNESDVALFDKASQKCGLENITKLMTRNKDDLSPAHIAASHVDMSLASKIVKKIFQLRSAVSSQDSNEPTTKIAQHVDDLKIKNKFLQENEVTNKRYKEITPHNQEARDLKDDELQDIVKLCGQKPKTKQQPSKEDVLYWLCEKEHFPSAKEELVQKWRDYFPTYKASLKEFCSKHPDYLAGEKIDWDQLPQKDCENLGIQVTAQAIKNLIKSGVDVNEVKKNNDEKQTPLLIACEQGNLFAAAIVAQHTNNLNQSNIHGLTALHYCAGYDNPVSDAIIDKIIAEKANLNLRNMQGKTPMIMACDLGNYALVKKLIVNGAECKVADLSKLLKDTGVDDDKRKELMSGFISDIREFQDKSTFIQSQKGQISTTRLIEMASLCGGSFIEKKDFTVDSLVSAASRKEKNISDTLLSIACSNGDEKMVKELILGGADVNRRNALNGYSPILYACTTGKKEVVKLLLEAGADVGVVDNNSQGVLHVLCCSTKEFPNQQEKKEWLETAAILIEADADLGHCDKYNNMALAYLSGNGFPEAVLMINKKVRDIENIQSLRIDEVMNLEKPTDDSITAYQGRNLTAEQLKDIGIWCYDHENETDPTLLLSKICQKYLVVREFIDEDRKKHNVRFPQKIMEILQDDVQYSLNSRQNKLAEFYEKHPQHVSRADHLPLLQQEERLMLVATKDLIASGANTSYISSDNVTLLAAACKLGNLTVAEVLFDDLAKKSDFKFADHLNSTSSIEQKGTVLHHCAIYANKASARLVTKIAKVKDVNMNSNDADLATPLVMVSLIDNFVIAKALLDAGAHLGSDNDPSLPNPLKRVISNEMQELILNEKKRREEESKKNNKNSKTTNSVQVASARNVAKEATLQKKTGLGL